VGHEKGVDVVWTKSRLYNVKNMRGSEYRCSAISESEWEEQSCRQSCEGVVSS
jgi:hypothetical protein